MKLTYTNVNGYLIPNLTYKSGEQMEQLGKYGFLRRDYLKNHRNSTYQVMLLQDTIGEHLLEVDKAAREREEVILEQLEEKEPLPDKEKDQMAWVRAANQHRAIAEEIISQFDSLVRTFLADNPGKSDEVKTFVKRYIKSGNYLSIKEPALAADLLAKFNEKFITK